MRFLRLIAGVAAAGMIGLSAPAASAQLPEGFDPGAAQSMVPNVIQVPAGQTTSVDVGVPVQASYAGGGWNVSASGTSVTITAPDQPGAQVAVPASALGYSKTITLVANSNVTDITPGGEDGAGAVPEQGNAETVPEANTEQGAGEAAPQDPSQEADETTAPDPAPGERNDDGASHAAAAAPTPQRDKAAPVDTAEAERLYFDGEIDGNVLTVQVSLTQAADLMPLADVNQEGLKLRYLDVNGNIIKDVEREIDVSSRTMTLTYPEGQTPDNPFIIEVVRDDSQADYIVTITATNAPVATPDNGEEGGENPYADIADGAEAQQTSGASMWPWAVAGVIVLAVLGLLGAMVARMRRR